MTGTHIEAALMWQNIEFLRRIFRMISLAALAFGVLIVLAVATDNAEWSWTNFPRLSDLWRAFRCGNLAGKVLFGQLVAVSAGFMFVFFGLSRKLRQKYLVRASLVYVLALFVMALALSAGESDCNFVSSPKL
jgi:hypothetical protein